MCGGVENLNFSTIEKIKKKFPKLLGPWRVGGIVLLTDRTRTDVLVHYITYSCVHCIHNVNGVI
jgi:hypothetical protein